jgi:hypothetical protein
MVNPTAASICDRETLFLRKNADLRKQKIQFTSKQPKNAHILLMQELRPKPIIECFHWPITGCGYAFQPVELVAFAPR